MTSSSWRWNGSTARPLSARLDRGVLPLGEAVRIGIEMLAALDALHGCGVKKMFEGFRSRWTTDERPRETKVEKLDALLRHPPGHGRANCTALAA